MTRYFRLAQEFIEEAKNSNNIIELSKAFEAVIKKLGCTYYACISNVDPLNPPKHAIVLSNYPAEWPLYFSEQNYHKIDPIYLTTQTRITLQTINI